MKDETTMNPETDTQRPKSLVTVAPFEERHQDQVHDLYIQIFGASEADAFKARWDWSQQENLYPDNSPKWVLLDNDAIVGFLGTIPLSYTIEGQRVIAHTPSDYMVHPDYRFHGIKLMQEFFRSCDNCVSCDDMAATIKVTEFLGATRVGNLVHHVKVLDARAVKASGRFRYSPGWAWWPVTQVLRVRDKWRAGRRQNFTRVEEIEGFDLRFDRFYRRMSQIVPVTVARDLSFLSWRYGEDSPHADNRIGIVNNLSGELEGYVIYKTANGDPTTGHILDLQVFPSARPEIGIALLTHAIESLRQSGAWIVRYNHLFSAFSLNEDQLQDLGFIPRSSHRLLVRFQDGQHDAIAQRQENWVYSYGDSEASHAAV